MKQLANILEENQISGALTQTKFLLKQPVRFRQMEQSIHQKQRKRPKLKSETFLSKNVYQINSTKFKTYILKKRDSNSRVKNSECLSINENQIQMELTSQLDIQHSQSTIIKNFTSLNQFFDFKPNFKLLYRATDNQFSVERFHQLCDDVSHTLVLCQTNGKYIFGGYTPLKWNDEYQKQGTYFKTDKSNSTFLFSLTRNQKYPIKINARNKAICCSNMLGPTFGGGYDILIRNNADTQYSSVSYFPRNFICKNNKANHRYLTGSKNEQFRLFQWEVYKVMKIETLSKIQEKEGQIDNTNDKNTIFKSLAKSLKNIFFKKQKQNHDNI